MKKYKFNVFGNDLQACSFEPITGYFRDGCCTGCDQDHGQHYVCSVMSSEFLDFSYKKGNDLLTPKAEFNFPGLKVGDKWCLCVERWLEALKASVAPKVVLESTNEEVLKKIDIEILKKFALDIN
tara:strand:+ start:412 stop:786 length:375 start_codon:yes stop_codon:yes gene_type:complete